MNTGVAEVADPVKVRKQLRGLIEQLQAFEAGLITPGSGHAVKPTLKQSVALTLADQGPLTVMELAAQLHVAHPGVVQAAKQLQSDGYLMAAKDRQDRRRRVLALTREGQHAFGAAIAQRDLLLSEPRIHSALSAAVEAVSGLSPSELMTDVRERVANASAIELKPLVEEDQGQVVRFIRNELRLEVSEARLDHVSKTMAKMVDHPTHLCAAAFLKSKGTLVGFILAEPHAHEVEVIDLLVHRQFRALGFGQMLLSWLSQASAQAGYGKLTINVSQASDQARVFLQKRGFTRGQTGSQGNDVYRLTRFLL